MVQDMRVIGKKINSMAKVRKLGQMVLPMKEIIKMEKNMEKDFLNGKMDQLLTEILLKIILKVLVNMCGLIKELI
jgi:hypothetical protein